MSFNPNASTVFADGPTSRPLQPDKAIIRAYLLQLEAATDAIASGSGTIAKQTIAQLNSDLAHVADTMAWVYADANPTNNGIYRKAGASGTGSWSFALPLPYTYIVASNSGSGTPNAIKATSSVPVTNGMLVSVNITVTNTLSPVTIAFNSQSALTLKTRSGQDVAPGDVTPGYLLGARLGTIFYLLSDTAVATLIYAARDAAFAARDAAQEAQADAELARDIAAGYASDAVSQGNVPLYSTHVGLSAISVPAGIQSGSLWGYYVNGDGGGKAIRRVASEPAHMAKVRSADRFLPNGSTDATNGGWWEIAEPFVNIKMLGAKGGGANDTAAFAGIGALGKPVAIPRDTYLIDFLDWSDRRNIVQMCSDGATLKKRIDDGKPLFQINTAASADSGYIAPNIIGDLTFDADGKADYAVLSYQTARWRWLNCNFINARIDGFLQMGGAHTLLDKPDAIGNGRAGIAFDKYPYGYPNFHTIRDGGIFNNGKYGVYFDGGRDLLIEGCDIEGTGVADDLTCAAIVTGTLVGSEGGTEHPGVIVQGGWIEQTVAGNGAIQLNSGFNQIVGTEFIANGTQADVWANGGTYIIDRAIFEGVRTHVKDTATVGVGNTIVNVSAAGTFDIDISRTSLSGAKIPWVEYVPVAFPSSGSFTSFSYGPDGYVSRDKRYVSGRARVGLSNHGNGSGDLVVTMPVTARENEAASAVSDNGKVLFALIVGGTKNCRILNADGTSFIADNVGCTINFRYEAQ